jgi:hypothetical protein
MVGGPVNTRLHGYLAPSSGTIQSAGELLVNTSTPRVFISFAMSSGGFADHSNPIPNTPSLSGVVVYTQGLLISGGPLALTNGIELHLR